MYTTETKNIKKIHFQEDYYQKFLNILDTDYILDNEKPYMHLSEKERLVSQSVEDFSFPSFIEAYKTLSGTSGIMVDKQDFIDYFLLDEALKQSWLDFLYGRHPHIRVSESMVNVIYNEYLMYRLARAYKSFVFERIYEIYFVSNFNGISVISHSYLDYNKGYDFIIKKNDLLFYVHITSNTISSKKVIEKKKKRGNDRDFNNHFYLFYDPYKLEVDRYDEDFIMLAAILNYLDKNEDDLDNEYESYDKNSQLYKDLLELTENGYTTNEKIEVLVNHG